ncbi:MAG: ABC transporter ATP-binding protein [Acidimicrobiales bacterium]|jgi:iron(III) transport system ATP-binding protein
MVRPAPTVAGSTAASGLEITGVYKSFGSQEVLTGIDLEVPEGSLTAILGPSGSGKTTLLRVTAGFERADRGTVVLGGRLVEDPHLVLPPEQRGIGYVPQEGSLFPHLTVAANVAFGVPRAARRKSERNISELLEMVGLAGLGDRYPHQLSGGQQQRVALARALAIRPTLVLLDEPFSSLDASLRSSVRSDVQDVLRAGGITAVLVTHDQDEALSIADRVAVIRDGVIRQHGTPQQLYDHPVDPGMARFLGNANLVPATVEGDRVDTPFGPMSLRPDSRTVEISGPVVALVRPEQLVISTTITGSGLRAVALRTQFHGHDTVITFSPRSLPGVDPISVRAEGELVVAEDTEVELTTRGSALVWPARGDSHSGSGESAHPAQV